MSEFVFKVETGNADVDSTSYVSAGYASCYFAAHPHYTSAWQALSSTQQENALMYATMTLDYWVTWQGQRSSEDQALRWPRYGVYDCDGYLIDSNIVPRQVKNATSELAYYLQANNETAEPDSKGIKSLKVGPIGIEFDKFDRDAATVIPDFVKSMLECFGKVRKRLVGGALEVIRR